MQLAKVIGQVVATRKDPSFEGVKLLVVQPVGSDGSDAGRPIVAVDSVGAGIGEQVFFVRGKEASFPFYPIEVPADAGIVGIVDHWSTVERDRASERDLASGRGRASARSSR
jgi:ethanolamine utilization protein EutN